MPIEVAILPQTVTRLHSRVVLVIDVIRATTSIVTLFERGMPAIVGHSRAQLGLDHDTVFCAQSDRTHYVPQLQRLGSAPDDMRMMWQGEAGT